MAYPLFSFFIFGCVLFRQINSFPPPNNSSTRYLKNFALDGRKNCSILNDQNVIVNINTEICPDFLPGIESLNDFFSLRSYLICFGELDALYHLCEFDIKEVNLTVPKELSNSTHFCENAANIYEKISFSYYGEEIKKWSARLKNAMTNTTLCENVCIVTNLINRRCSTMVTAAREYNRLKGLKDIPSTNNTADSTPIDNSSKENKLVKSTSLVNPNTSVLNDDKNHPNGNVSSAVPLKGAEETDENLNERLDIKNEKPDLATPSQVIPVIAVNNKSEPINIKEPSKNENPVQPGVEVTSGAQPQETHQINISPTQKDDVVDDQELPPVTDPEPLPGQKDSEDVVNPEVVNPIMWSRVRNSSEDSYTFSYFATVAILCFAAYFIFHYKNKLLALALEGRKGRNHRGRGRPSSANYSKLHSNLEEAIASNVTTPSATHVLY